MATNITNTHATNDIRGGETGLGLRWVLGVSLAAVVIAFIAVIGANIAG